MPNFVRRYPEVYEAYQWFKIGDHPREKPVISFISPFKDGDHPEDQEALEEKIDELETDDYGYRDWRDEEEVRKFHVPLMAAGVKCPKCGRIFKDHGYIPNNVMSSPKVICPGDWIVYEGFGYEVYNDKEFKKIYEEV